ncbi:MAG: hypothetical protein K9G11_04735 [Rickettsiaceae bacterium]|nr:hypothetical protein [Rickettsiaceae bacterium]
MVYPELTIIVVGALCQKQRAQSSFSFTARWFYSILKGPPHSPTYPHRFFPSYLS